MDGKHTYNGPYSGDYLNRVAFPIGGIGAGMICLEGAGAVSHVSVRNQPEVFNEPMSFAALSIKGEKGNIAKVLEGPVPGWKVFGSPGTGNGAARTAFGLPRFDEASFLTRFPFGIVTLRDAEIPLEVQIHGWSPFIPGEPDDSSLPTGALEYVFTNRTDRTVEGVFSYNTQNFIARGGGDTILPIQNGFVLDQPANPSRADNQGAFACFTDDPGTVVDHCWFRGGWWDSLTLAWRNIEEGRLVENPPQKGSCPGASLFVPITVKPGETRTVRLMLAWYVPKTSLRHGQDATDPASSGGPAFGCYPSKGTGPGQQDVSGFSGKGLVNTYDSGGDAPTGTLTSPEFEITANKIQFLIGGGNKPGKACMNLLVGGNVVRTATGKNQELLELATWDVEEFRGKQAKLQIVDDLQEAWGHINIDLIVMVARAFESALALARSKGSLDVTVLHDFESEDYGSWVAEGPAEGKGACACEEPTTVRFYEPWYAGKFSDVAAVADYWRKNYGELRRKSVLFRDAFYDTTLPPEVVEAVAANLTILKSPTVLRQSDGRLWCWEGCCDGNGCCAGSCTHVWNYAQALPHLFPSLERTLRQTEFHDSQDERGHQVFRSALPIRPIVHDFHAAADGQLGGILKVYREWRVSGDSEWLKAFWPQVEQSLVYCIDTWDPRAKGVLEEPHHNTYDIEYWGPDGHCSSFYLGALAAAVEMGSALGRDVERYATLLARGRKFLETELYNGEYFFQKIQTEGLNAKFHPLDASANGPGYEQIIQALNTQGPKYQYGTGCLSDGVLGFWMARVCGLDDEIVDSAKVKSNLKAIYKYNLKHDLSDHPNPQRPSYALGKEGGLLLCTWPRGGALAIPFVYSDEVWTGIEYQVASHLMFEGMVDEGLDVVRVCRDRYDGRVRNPFNEYECGHWYARAMSSYGLIEGLSGVRYDAVEKTLYIDSRIGEDFRSFLSTNSGFATVGLKGGKPFLDAKLGTIEVENVVVSGEKMALQ